MTRPTHIFRAVWPITDGTTGLVQLLTHAFNDIPLLQAQAHAQPTGPGRWTFARSTHIPGSGRTTPWVLLYECPARHQPGGYTTHRTNHHHRIGAAA